MRESWDAEGFRSRLASAAEAFDFEAVDALCGRLIAYLRRSGYEYPHQEAQAVLALLRRKRRFQQMQDVADALIRGGSASPGIRRSYAQSMIDLGNLSAAIAVLEDLLQETEGSNAREHAECSGLLGRAYKQIYIDASGSGHATVASALQRAIRLYRDTYRSAPDERAWQGINAAACLSRAVRDGVRLPEISDPAKLATEIADEILDAVNDRRTAGGATVWDYATAMEACLALGKWSEAMGWLVPYTAHPDADAFELASTERQLVEVWGLSVDSESGASLLPLLRAALLRREGGAVEMGTQDMRPGPLDRMSKADFERVLGADSFVTFGWYQTGLERSRAVARIGLEADRGLGTGFLLRAGDLWPDLGDELVLLTNAHVVSDDPEVDAATRPDDAVVTLQELDGEAGSRNEYAVQELLWTSPPWELDASLLRLNRPIHGVMPYPIARRLPAVGQDEHQRVYIIGHPGGGTLAFSIHDNLLLEHEGPPTGRPPRPSIVRLHYRAPTEGGSSGSPVFNQQWKLIGLHHKGGRLQRLNGGRGRHAANEGIWIGSIREALCSPTG